MEREIISIVTPRSGIEIKMKSWITGREKREIQAIFLEGADFKSGETKFSGEQFAKSQDKTIELVVVSVGGKDGNIVNDVLDLPNEDYDFVIAEINKITSTSEEDKKKQK